MTLGLIYRQQAHKLILSLYEQAEPREQADILAILWTLWPSVSQYGRKGMPNKPDVAVCAFILAYDVLIPSFYFALCLLFVFGGNYQSNYEF